MQYEFYKYIYEGPVMEFDTCVSNHWKGETMAPTEKKARSNLTYQFKKQNNKSAGTKIRLTGKIKMVN